jgi:hypothetical protein
MSTNNTNNISLDYLADQALLEFNRKLPQSVVGKFSIDVSPKAGAFGDTISVPLYGTVTAQEFAGNYTDNSASTVNEREVKLDRHPYAAVHVSDTDAANGIKLESLAKQAGAAMATCITTGIMSTFTTGNFGAPVLTVAPNNFTHSGLLFLRGSSIEWDEKNVIMDSPVMTSVYSSTTSLSANIANSAVAGQLTSMYGMGIDECTSQIGLPAQKIQAVVAHPSALAVGFRALRPPVADGGNVQIVVKEDPVTKIPMTFRMFQKPDEGKTWFVAEGVYGVSVGLTGSARLVAKP